MKWIFLAVFIIFLVIVAFLVLYVVREEDDIDELVREEQEYRWFRHMERDEDDKKG